MHSIKKITNIVFKTLKVIFVPLLFAGTIVIVITSVFAFVIFSGFQGPTDTVKKLNRFELSELNGRIILIDRHYEDSFNVIVSQIEKYVIKDDFIYIFGDYGNGITDKNGKHWPTTDYFSLKTGEMIFYQEGEPVPHYLILNTRTAELRKYVIWGEIPEEDQKIFEQAKPYVFDSWELNKL